MMSNRRERLYSQNWKFKSFGYQRQWLFWCGTNQDHIITNFLFRNCGYRSDEFNQYDTSPDRGCSKADNLMGCHQDSTVLGFLTIPREYKEQKHCIWQLWEEISSSRLSWYKRQFDCIRKVSRLAWPWWLSQWPGRASHYEQWPAIGRTLVLC